jgi:hypothetical protein
MTRYDFCLNLIRPLVPVFLLLIAPILLLIIRVVLNLCYLLHRIIAVLDQVHFLRYKIIGAYHLPR